MGNARRALLILRYAGSTANRDYHQERPPNAPDGPQVAPGTILFRRVDEDYKMVPERHHISEARMRVHIAGL